MVPGVIQNLVLPAAETELPEGPSHDAAPDLAAAEKGIARREAPHRILQQRRAPADLRGHHREGQRDHEALADLQVLRLDAGICQSDVLHRGSIALGQLPEGVPPLDAVQAIPRVPGQQRPVGLPPGDAVAHQALLRLKAPQRAVRPGAENPVRRERPETRPVQGQLQQLHRRAHTPRPQNTHSIPSNSSASTGRTFKAVYAPCGGDMLFSGRGRDMMV